MRLAAPNMLWLLAFLVGPLVLFLWWAWRKRQQLITQFISARLLAHLKVGVSASRQKARLYIIVAAVVFIIFALAQPQWGVTREEARQRGLDIIVAVDTSNSMLADDVPPDRLTRAKLAVLDLMHRARTDRLGLVAFAGDAFLECPLTLDDAAFSQSVDALDTKTISQGGTSLASAIEEAHRAFKNESDNHKVMVLFTDGEDQDAGALEAAKAAAKDGVIIFTIGIGTAEGEKIRVRDERGHVDFIQDENGNPVVSKLNESLLQQIASATKGFYLPLRGTKTMDTLYDGGIAPLPKSENSTRLFQRFHEQYQWPLAIAIGLLILEMFMPERSRRRPASPTAQQSSAPQTTPVLTETVAILFLLAIPLAAWGSPASALREYDEGKYQEAFKDYDKLAEKKQDDPRLQFNAGAAAYQSHQYDIAAKQFNQALTSPDLNLQQRSYYNLGNSFYRLGQEIPETDADKKQEAWENAVKSYESALKLNQQDADAKFNQDFVQKQLEELKKQQQQQQKQGKDKDKNKDNKDNKDQQNQAKNDQKNQQPDKSKPDNQQQNKSGQNSQDQNQQAQSEKEKQEKQQQQEKSDEEKAKQEKQENAQEQNAEQSPEKTAEDAKREAEMMAAGQMTPSQAQQLLDADKDEEHVFQPSPTNSNNSQSRTLRNW